MKIFSVLAIFFCDSNFLKAILNLFWFYLGDKNLEKERSGGNGIEWGELAGILMPFWRSFMVWMDRGLLQSRPYLRGTKLTFQGGQEGNLSEFSGLCGVCEEPESKRLFYGHRSAALQPFVFLWSRRSRGAKNSNFLRKAVYSDFCVK